MVKSSVSVRIVALVLGGVLLVQGLSEAPGQSADPKSTAPRQQGEQDAKRKDGQRKLDEFAEAAKLLGGPAANPECVWLGRRVVDLLWRDDLDTAFRHLDLYDRFGCPAGHIQATFRCVVRQGDPKPPETLPRRVHTCWINPNPEPGASAPSPATSGASGR